MLTSLNWLKDYVDINLNAQEIESLLTNSGTKVETIEPVNATARGIVAGKITKIEKHPDADRLKVCTVDTGEAAPLTIVTSAGNVFEGALVPVAVADSTIADGTVMKDTVFRGINSQGMFCSVEELGMNKDLFSKEITDGIYILPEDFVAPGTELRAPLWIDDEIIDIELTANRGDCQSVYGIAREAAAAQNFPVRDIDLSCTEGTEDISDYLTVDVKTELCPRYVARMFKVNKIEPSPMWMQLRLLNSGVRPINNIVDVTNYVMLEMGQPLHAFDYHSVGTKNIVVKTDNPEKTVVTLDGQERAITPDMMMITNGEHPIAVAGVMGGVNSEITDDTEYVVLESACFDKTSIRLTAKVLGLRTEAASRYIKGIYPQLAAQASQRAAHLFEAIGAATPVGGVIDINTSTSEAVTIPVDTDWLNAFLGTALSTEDIQAYLNRLFLKTEQTGEHTVVVTVPDYRQDLRIREDIAEEVARLYGYNNLPSTLMSGAAFTGEKTDYQKYRDLLTAALIGLGSNQTMTTSFVSPNKIKALDPELIQDEVKIINPLGEDSSLMRSTLLVHQLDLISLNENRGNPEGAFFEIQKTYHQAPEGELPREEMKLALSEYGKDADFYSLKGKIETLLALSGIEAEFTAGGSTMWHPGRKAVVSVNGEKIGELGEVHPSVVKTYDLPKRVYAAELSFDKLFKAAELDKHFKELPKYPGTQRDLAIVVNADVPAGAVLKIIKDNAGELLEDVELFDIYTGAQLPEGKKSLAYNLKFRHPERTLTEEDINPVITHILNILKESLSAELRA